MSDEYGYEEYTTEDTTEYNTRESGGIKALREKAEADSKRIQELSDKLARLEEQSRKSSVSDLFKAEGVNPQIANLYRGDPTPEKVQEFLTENAELFGIRQGEGNPSHEEADTTVDSGTSALSPEQTAAYQAMQSAGAGVTGQRGNDTDTIGAINSANTAEELFAAMQRHGWNGGFGS